MSVRLMERVWSQSRVRPLARLLLLAFADHAHDDGAGARPGYQRLAARTGISLREVRRLVGELEAQGYLTVLRVPGRASRYVVHPEAATGVQQTPPMRGLPGLTPGPPDPTGRVDWAAPPGPPGSRTVREPLIEPERNRSGVVHTSQPLPVDAESTTNLYRLYRLMTETPPDERRRRWMDDLTVQAGSGDEGRSQVASLMRRWWTEGKPAGKDLLGWTSHQLRITVRG